uniref:SFRICE_002536 n=1 Tax=Spodoptera frugiperda TaxID=7108 RepID=A0A2H1WD89_SPOFR
MYIVVRGLCGPVGCHDKFGVPSGITRRRGRWRVQSRRSHTYGSLDETPSEPRASSSGTVNGLTDEM